MKLSTLLCFVIAGYVSAGVATGANDFENGKIPEGWFAEKGGLEISSLRAKENQKSLLWQWRKGGKLTVYSPDILKHITTVTGGGDSATDDYEPRFVEDTKQGGIKTWIYNEKPSMGKLLFRFGSKERVSVNPRYQFEFNLNFRGWRAMWVHFEEDAKNPSYNGDGPVTTMEVVPPDTISQGAIYFDLFEFTEYVTWKRTADCQLPMLNKSLNEQKGCELKGDEEVETWNDLYVVSQLRPSDKPAKTITESQKQAFNEIERRYEEWVLGTGNVQEEPVKIRKKAVMEFIQKGIKKYELLQIKRNGDFITGLGLYTVRDTRKPSFGDAVLEPVILPLALDYRINGSKQSLQKAMNVFDYLYDQGWAYGSGLGTMNHQSNQISGYMHAVYLLKDELKRTGRLEREIGTMRWMISFNEVYTPKEYKGATADTLRTKYIYRLLAVLCMDDSPQKVQDMQHLCKWLSFALQIAPGFEDTIKPDFTGYHHRGVYGSAYAPQAFHMASIVVYLLHNTPFAIEKEAHENLRQALLSQRLYCNTYDAPPSISGRFPYHTTILNRMLPSYTYLALAKEPVDVEMGSVFKRLWKPKTEFLGNLFTKAECNISYFDTLGAVELMCKLAARNDVEPEAAPSGHWTKPYAGLAIHRRDEWLLTVKGWSQYIWDFEASKNQNLYGRYISNGTMQIYTAGDPISSLDNGYDPDSGWDWNRWPGTTAVHLPWKNLIADKSVSKDYPEGKHRNFSDETFVGGVDFENCNGVFAIKLHDTVYDKSFRANKSYFFFNNEIICLGSGINDDTEFSVETTLFQFCLKNANLPTYVNGAKGITQRPYSFQGKAENIWLMDPIGNAYILPDGSGLHLILDKQQSPNHSGKKNTTGDFATAWIDHGKRPMNEGYEYAVIVKTTPEKAAEYAQSPQYEVLQRNNSAHIVQHRKLGLIGYAIFDAKHRIAYGPLEKTNAPVLVMAFQSAGDMKLSVCDPDFRRPKMRNMSLMSSKVLYAGSLPQKIELQLKGCWRLKKELNNVEIMKCTNDRTVLNLECVDAKTIELNLEKVK